MTDMPLAALIKAWQITVLVVALAFSWIWDIAGYLAALQQALSLDG